MQHYVHIPTSCPNVTTSYLRNYTLQEGASRQAAERRRTEAITPTEAFKYAGQEPFTSYVTQALVVAVMSVAFRCFASTSGI